MMETIPLSNEEKEQLRSWSEKQGFESLKGGGWFINGLRQHYEKAPELLDKHIRFFEGEKKRVTVNILKKVREENRYEDNHDRSNR